MEYKKEWQELEELANTKFVAKKWPTNDVTNNYSHFTLKDADAMYFWLQYAASIGDKSYLEISDEVISPFPNWKRPFPFQPI